MNWRARWALNCIIHAFDQLEWNVALEWNAFVYHLLILHGILTFNFSFINFMFSHENNNNNQIKHRKRLLPPTNHHRDKNNQHLPTNWAMDGPHILSNTFGDHQEMVPPPPSSTSPTESTSSGISSQKSNMGLDELIESLSFFVESSSSSSPTGGGGGVGGGGGENTTPVIMENQRQTVTNSNSGRANTLAPLRSKRELIASMNGTIRRGYGGGGHGGGNGDFELSSSSNNSNHSERNGGVSWSNQVIEGMTMMIL